MKIYPESWVAFIAFLAVLYIALIVLVYLNQSSMLYIPGEGSRDMARHMGWRCWPDAVNFHGFISEHPPRNPAGTILVWHGNAGSALDRGYYMNAFQDRGWRVILMEYPGYGDRSGKPGEKAFLADAEAAVRIALEQFDGPVILLGESLGNGVASAMAARFGAGSRRDDPRGGDPGKRILGLIMITPWATLPDLAQSLYPFLPAKWLTRDRFDNITQAGAYPGPTAVLMAEKDTVIPNAHTERLYESLPEPKKLWIFSDHGHNDWPSYTAEKWWDEVLGFIVKSAAETVSNTGN